MTTNFRYKAKDSDITIRGLFFQKDIWLETENRIPLSLLEESKLVIEVREGDDFVDLMNVLRREATNNKSLMPHLTKMLDKNDAVVRAMNAAPASVEEVAAPEPEAAMAAEPEAVKDNIDAEPAADEPAAEEHDEEPSDADEPSDEDTK